MEQIRVAIPDTGRMAIETLAKLSDQKVLDSSWVESICDALDNVRKTDDETGVWDYVINLRAKGINALTVKYDLRSGWRSAFAATQATVNGVPTIFYGSETPTINGIRQGLADLAIIGYDDLLATMAPFIRFQEPGLDLERPNPFMVQHDFNTAIIDPLSTDVRIIGSAGLNDYAGLCLITNVANEISASYESEISTGKIPVYVKGRYQGLALKLLGDKVDLHAIQDIETALKSCYSYGLDIVRTGTTLYKEGFKIVDRPRLVTYAVIVADQSTYGTKEFPTNAQLVANAIGVQPDLNFIEGLNWIAALYDTKPEIFAHIKQDL